VNIRVAVCLPRDAQTVPLLRAMVGNALETIGVTTECVDEIRLALTEACANVVEHAAADDEYEIRLDVDDKRCEIRVTNTLNTLDAATLQGVMPDPTSARGRGVAIMRALMDHVEFISEPEAGTMVHLVKSLTLNPDAPLSRLR
jgi:serine/threonine-protein kinase RsbW